MFFITLQAWFSTLLKFSPVFISCSGFCNFFFLISGCCYTSGQCYTLGSNMGQASMLEKGYADLCCRVRH